MVKAPMGDSSFRKDSLIKPNGVGNARPEPARPTKLLFLQQRRARRVLLWWEFVAEQSLVPPEVLYATDTGRG